tara:strand:+ start:417 stop:818 length:402 start_codon:yes stop_codon:yes gene_type:complete
MKKNKFDLLMVMKKIKHNKSVMGLDALNKEKSKLNKIKKDLNFMIEKSKLKENELLSSSELKQISNYQSGLQNKLNITNNREKYLSREISSNILQISKLNKQKEKIQKKINTVKTKKLEFLESKSEILIINKY